MNPRHQYQRRSNTSSFLITWLLCLTVLGNSQGTQIFHDVSDGLSQNTVTSLVQDDDGYLWIGTRYGLNKYDGMTYTHYLHNPLDSNSLSTNTIERLALGTEHTLWVGTNDAGLNRFHIPTQTVKHYTIENSMLKSNYIRSLYIDSDGLLYIAGEDTGLDIYDTENERFLEESDHPVLDALSTLDVTAISGNQSGKLLFGTAGNTVYYYDSALQSLQEQSVDSPVRSVYYSGEKEVYVGTHTQLYSTVINKNSFDLRPYPIPDLDPTIILSIYKDSQSTLWIGTENNGLYTLTEDGRYDHYSNDNVDGSISSNSIWNIYEDEYGILWFGFYLKGLNKVDPYEKKFNGINDAATPNGNIRLNLVNITTPTDANTVYIGLDGGGLIKWNMKTNTYEEITDIWPANSNTVVTSLYHDSDKLYITTWQDGLIIYDLEKKAVIDLEVSKEEICTRIHDVLIDKNANTWTACYMDGLKKIMPNRTVVDYLDQMSIRTLAIDCNGHLLIGTDRGGLMTLNLDSHDDGPQSSPLVKNNITINSLLIDSDCNTWVGSEGLGLYKVNYDGTTVEHYTLHDGLNSNMIYSLEEDKNGNIWGSTNNGLFMYDTKGQAFTPFTTSDGLVSDEYGLGASGIMADGTLLFGGIDGVNYFRPDDIKFNKVVPRTFISSVVVSGHEGKALAKTEDIYNYNGRNLTTQYNQNDLTFHYTGINFTQGERNKFQYQLEGYDEQWQKQTLNRSAEYNNLPPGRYTFKVKAANNDGIWNDNAVSVDITITKPWYRHWLAWLLYLGSALSLLYIARRIIYNRIKLQNELKLEHVEVLKLKEVDKIKSRFFDNISHEFLTPLTLILTPLKSIQSKGDNTISDSTVNNMVSNANRLQKFIKQILALAKLESGNVKLRVQKHNISPWIAAITDNFRSLALDKQITFTLDITDSIMHGYYDEDRLEQVIINLLSNAFKYTPDGGRVSLSLKEKHSHIEVAIKDNGGGISKDAVEQIWNRFYRQKNENLIGGTGIGLSITKQIIDQHDGEIEVKSKLGEGSTFTIKLKKGKEHFESNPLVELERDSPGSTEPYPLQLSKVGLIQGSGKALTDQPQLPILLVVEDNPDIRQLLTESLNSKYEVHTADNGITGVEMAKRLLPDLIITDLMMPGKTGYELCAEIKGNKFTSHISIIMLTVKSSEESTMEGFAKGADYYMTKPFNIELLHLRIQNILKNRQVAAKSVLEKKENPQIETTEESQAVPLSDIDKEFLNRLNTIIEENIANSEFSVVDLTQQLGFSKSQLYRKLKAILGTSANTYIRTKRLNTAADLIKTNSYTIAEVTYKVGFNDLQYFRSCFKNQFGVNPSEYDGH